MVSVETTQRLDSTAALRELAQSLKVAGGQKAVVSVCLGTGCAANGAGELHEALLGALDELGMADRVEVRSTGCHGFCELGPVVVTRPQGIFYKGAQPGNARDVLRSAAGEIEPVEELLYEADGQRIAHERDVPFYKRQMRIALRFNGLIDPFSIEDYILEGGYLALAKALDGLTPEEVIDEVSRSGLRGRGGGGFATGRKWASCRQAHGEPRYVICNGDEGDPGAFMDRSIMEANPHAVLEGMLIGSYAIGASEGYIYVRAEYPLAVRTLTAAIEQARQYGVLGQNILGSGHSFDVKIARGGGAFVCGESTALMASVEGHVGEPRAKHIHTVESGLYERPTTLNNVETWSNVPVIIERGAEWFSQIGTEKSKGTKVFSLVGKVKNTGLVEVPMGITLREIIYDIGGGPPDGKEFKAVQTGGPSGGCIPAQHLDMPVDFDALTKVGSMMGSGGMIVMDEDSCMVDVARYFLDFLRQESCGKCTPCREGNRRMFEILDDICNGRATEDDLALLEEIADLVKNTSLCALGKSAPNPVLSTIRYFRDEYEAHIKDRRCPAGVCKALVTFSIDPEQCICCGRCARDCPVECISGRPGKAPAKATEQDRQKGKVGQPFAIDPAACIKCGNCLDVCPAGAVERT